MSVCRHFTMMFSIVALCSVSLIAQAQESSQTGTSASSEGIDVEVEQGGVVLIQMAVPRAINQQGEVDTFGLTEALSGTVQRNLMLSSFLTCSNPHRLSPNPIKKG